MNALHQSWKDDQADAFARQRERILRDSAFAWAHPSPEVQQAARALRRKLDQQRNLRSPMKEQQA